MNFAASQAALMKESSKANGYDWIRKGAYNEIISLAESKYSLKEESLNVKTLLTRIKQGKLNHSGRGHVSPMLALEAHFVDVICNLQQCGNL
jgi:hypothetical protein